MKPNIHYNLHKIPHNEPVCIISKISLRSDLILIHIRICSSGVQAPEQEAVHSVSRMHGAIPPLPYIFMKCTRTTLHFMITIKEIKLKYAIL